ncbi:MAG TPA: hypothetical protein VM781_00900 [Candidatus Bathyarchaeia archaeon]|nr:hypothetical protein [Candidatus Bathyarchaeia archaeon]
MWRLALGTVLSPLPRRWRVALQPEQGLPWVSATVLSGLLESLLAFVGLVYWYYLSIATWAANAMDSALRNGPERAVPAQAIGFSALLLWLMHPFSWLIGFFLVEGLLRWLAAAFTEQTFGTLPLAFADWCYGKVTGRPAEGDALHLPSARAQVQSLILAVKEKIVAMRLPEVADELLERSEGGEAYLEIHSSHRKAEWIPPKTVRIGEAYFRLEQLAAGEKPRPYVFLLRRVAAGVPGWNVIVYQPPRDV